MADYTPLDRRTHVAGTKPHQSPPPKPTFEDRVVAIMRTTGRDRTWALQRAREQFPDEARAAGKD